jgi:hypothetical protein
MPSCGSAVGGALSAVLRWGWITVNPLEAVKRPRQQHPQPNPPSTEEAARIVSAAWRQDAHWGTFVWLTFITGARRGELLVSRQHVTGEQCAARAGETRRQPLHLPQPGGRPRPEKSRGGARTGALRA